MGGTVSGKELIPLTTILLLLGLSKIFDLMTSINNLIMIYSKWYHVNLILLLIMATCNIILNTLFIDLYGILGASVATLISVFTFNLLKTGFIFIKLNIQPITKNTLYILSILTLGLLLTTYLHNITILNPVISIGIYTVLVSAIFLPIFYFLKLSPELNGLLDKLIRKVKR